MGNVSAPLVKHYWSRKDEKYEHPVFGNSMPRNSFAIGLKAYLEH